MSVEIAGKVLAEVRRRGSDAVDLRDAAHEASHALEFNLRGKWTRDRIHQAVIKRTSRSSVIRAVSIIGTEIRARAIEQIVCQRLGVSIERIEVFASVALLEMGCTFGSCPPETEFISAIRSRMNATNVIAMAERVIALGGS